jgi:flagellar assembly factor FliW
MIVENTRFGDVEYSADDIIEFVDGPVGFSGCREFLLLNHKHNSPYRWLQSLEDRNLAFLLAFPEALVPNYNPELGSAVEEELEIMEGTPLLVLTTVNIPSGKPEEATLNLLAPVVINGATMKAKQVILFDDAYTVKHRVYAASNRVAEKVAA